jgi:arginine/serine-rich splicing factor 7
MSLFIGNIANEVTKKELEDLFGKYGKCEIKYKGAYAFAEYSLDKEAEAAKSELNKKEVNKRILSIEWSKKSKNYTGKRYDEVSPRGKCYTCGRNGHYARDCPERRRSNSRRHYHSKRRYRSRSRSHRHHHKRRYRSSRSSSRRSSRRSPRRYRRRSNSRRSRRSRSRSRSSYYRRSRSRKSRDKSNDSKDSRNYDDNKSWSKKDRSRSNSNSNNNNNSYIKDDKNYNNEETNNIK